MYVCMWSVIAAHLNPTASIFTEPGESRKARGVLHACGIKHVSESSVQSFTKNTDIYLWKYVDFRSTVDLNRTGRIQQKLLKEKSEGISRLK